MAKKNYNSSEEARQAILDAAEQVVVQVGPAGLRISAVAKKAGMAHPNIIHHFGSRQGLLNALAERVSNRATERITTAISQALISAPENLLDAMTHVLDTAYQGDEGKVAVWMHLSGTESSLKDNMQQIVALAHELRKSIDEQVDISNTHRLVMLVTLALVGEVVSGKAIKEALGFNDNHRAQFHQWLAQILLNLSDSELTPNIDKP